MFRCIFNDFLFTQIICNGNQSNRYIICCSDKNDCNDRDVYAGEIRKQLSLLSNFAIQNHLFINLKPFFLDKSNRFSFKLTLLIIGSTILLLLLIISLILIRIKRKTYALQVYKLYQNKLFLFS